MKKKYKKPEIVFEKLAFKSALATCGYVSTKRINDAFSCDPVKGDSEFTWPGDVGEPAIADGDIFVLINGNSSICESSWSCYHVPDVMMEGAPGSTYIGLS